MNVILYLVSSCIDRRLRLRVVDVAPHMRSIARRMSINRLSSPRPRSFVIKSIDHFHIPSYQHRLFAVFHSSYNYLDLPIQSIYSYPKPLKRRRLVPPAVPAKRNLNMAEAKEIELLCNNLRFVPDHTSLLTTRYPVEMLLSLDVELL